MQQDVIFDRRPLDWTDRKLTYDEANEARGLYASGHVTQSELAAYYGVSQPAISRLILHATYARARQRRGGQSRTWPYASVQLTDAGRRVAPSCPLGEGWPYPSDLARGADPVKLYPVGGDA